MLPLHGQDGDTLTALLLLPWAVQVLWVKRFLGESNACQMYNHSLSS